jgi:hypothetical protein
MSTTDIEKELAWNKVITKIEAIAGMKKVYQGFVDPDTIPSSHFPCSMLEPNESTPIEDEYWGISSSWGLQSLSLILWFFFRIFEKQKRITGTASIPGVFDWEKTIKKALVATPLYLDNTVINVSFGNIRYLRSMTEQPKQGIIRGFELELLLPVMEHLR